MKILKFTDSEIAELRNFYQQQLENTLEKLETIRGILNKIDTDKKETEENQVTSKPPDTLEIDERERTESITQRPFDTLEIDEKTRTEPKKRKKKEIKSKWGNFILDLLRQHDKPIKFNDIVEEAIYKFGIPKDKYENVRQSIINSSFKLRNIHKRTRNFKVTGEMGKYLGLSRWFDKNGELKEKYKEKLIPILTEKATMPKWSNLILETLLNKNTLCTTSDITNLTMQKYKLPQSEFVKVKKAIGESLSRMKNKRKTIKVYKTENMDVSYYGLTRWFDKNSELKEKYKAELTSTLTEKGVTQKEIDIKTTEEKPVWGTFVLNTIKENDKLFQSKTLTNIAIEKFKINESDYEKTRLKVASALSKQEIERKKLKTYSKDGVKGRYYGLSEWFVNNEELARHLKTN